MKKKLFLSICMLIVLASHAQVIINLQLPPVGLTIRPQLWNLSLINTTNEDFNARIEMVLTDASNNHQVFSGITKTFRLLRGIKQIQVSDVMPITYNHGKSIYGIDPNPDGFLPLGLFNVCYTVIKDNRDAIERLSEECETIEIAPISPPQLILPADNESVEIARPFFSWLPPSPHNMFNDLIYDWVLVEIMSTQSPANAVQLNIPVLQQSNVRSTNYQYPLALPELDTSKHYAWRVTAKNNSSGVASSEIWTFRVKKFAPETPILKSSAFFSRLKREEDASYVICNGVLRYEYHNELNSNEVSVRILDIGSKTRRELKLDSSVHAIKFGQNFIQMDLGHNNDLKEKNIYLFELTNAKSEKWFLKFEYRKP